MKSDNLINELTEHCQNQKDKYYEDILGDLWQRPGFLNPTEYINRGWTECIDILEKVKEALTMNLQNIDPCDLTGEGWIAEEAYATALLCFLKTCLLYTSPSPRDQRGSRMPSSA